MNCAAIFAAELQEGAVIALVGDLGMGKTHFTKGLLKGLGSSDVVTSPTFAILQEYTGGRLPAFHFDLYRLESVCLLYTSPSPRDKRQSRMPSSA